MSTLPHLWLLRLEVYKHHHHLIAMFNPQHEMVITVSGGSFEENQQMCTAVRSSLQKTGFKNIQVEEGHAWGNPYASDETLLACIHAINPDLRDAPILVQGECQQDIESQVSMLPAFYGNGISAYM